eukprot:gnl/MRDRNA2_/MRDRNA2_109808_c0_seq1.p1 gnl/MRDRNA2_/MRDRNA2_109808_c0~~gnl/MRDRNA2_/MRDRNA2_109808_c0_seq1.p1  ORF type:complete len:385 (+),score=66.31 gnl/MRDRNA2_/MRDRNA2_109808_c0_seq1:81-1235(+)
MIVTVSVWLCLLMQSTSLKLNSDPGPIQMQEASELMPKNRRPRCKVPLDFQREVNPHAVRQPTEEEMSQEGFYDEPSIEGIYYINLAQSHLRQSHMEEMLKRLTNGEIKYERFNAINKTGAREIDAHGVHEFSDLGIREKNMSGTHACYYSHFNLVKKISEHNNSNAVFIILEDDVTFDSDVLEEVRCQLKLLPPDWDTFKFGYMGEREWPKKRSGPPSEKPWKYPECPDYGNHLYVDQNRTIENEYTCYQADWNWAYMGNQAYALRPQGAANMLKHLRRRPIMDFDGAIMPQSIDLHGGEGWANTGPAPWINTYVSKFNLALHVGYFESTLRSFKMNMSDTVTSASEVSSKPERQDFPDEYADFLEPVTMRKVLASMGESDRE